MAMKPGVSSNEVKCPKHLTGVGDLGDLVTLETVPEMIVRPLHP
jgi:hypothetical protein